MLYSLAAAPAAMHIPDGFLSTLVALLMWPPALIAVAYALKGVNKELGERQVPLMGVLAATIFAGQMLNFPVAGGTSGHLMGAALATIILGPRAGILVMTSVVGVQALLFQDGGLLALGANVFNMAVLGVLVAYGVYEVAQRLARGQRWGLVGGGFAAAWISIFVAAQAVALGLVVSGTAPANLAIPAMAAAHVVMGIGEGLITVGALLFLSATRPDVLRVGAAPGRGNRAVAALGLALALLLALAAPWASSHPDGLMSVAAAQGFAKQEQAPFYTLIPNYLFPGVADSSLGTIIAALLGTVIVFGVALAVAYMRRNRQAAAS